MQIVQASSDRQKRIVNLKKAEILIRVNKMVNDAYVYAGHTSKLDGSNDKIHAQLVSSFTQELISDFSYFTLDEVEIAIVKGLRGEYGEYQGINNLSLYKFLIKYKESMQRKEAIEKQRKYIDALTKPKELSNEEKEKILYVGALRKFSEFKKNKSVYDAGGVTYNYLTRLGIICYDEEKRQIFKERAKHKLKEQTMMKGKKQTMSGIQVQDFIKLITDDNFMVICEAKSMALNDFFKSLVEVRMELYEKLENILHTENGI